MWFCLPSHWSKATGLAQSCLWNCLIQVNGHRALWQMDWAITCSWMLVLGIQSSSALVPSLPKECDPEFGPDVKYKTFLYPDTSLKMSLVKHWLFSDDVERPGPCSEGSCCQMKVCSMVSKQLKTGIFTLDVLLMLVFQETSCKTCCRTASAIVYQTAAEALCPGLSLMNCCLGNSSAQGKTLVFCVYFSVLLWNLFWNIVPT